MGFMLLVYWKAKIYIMKMKIIEKEKCLHKLNKDKTYCIKCGVKVLGIAKKNMKKGDLIRVELCSNNFNDLYSNEINFLEHINLKDLL